MRNLLEEIPLWVCTVHAPPVVDEHVEDTQGQDEENGRPFGLEANGDHTACCETDDGNEGTRPAPFSPDHETDEKEDQENPSSQ